MSIDYNTAAVSGKRFSVTIGENTYRSIPATSVEVLLRRAGLTLKDARERIAIAKLTGTA